jgi:hypothetical protein
MKTKRALAALSLVAMVYAGAQFAKADAPGPGSTQCSPGQNGPPAPGSKPPPSCPGK